MSRATNQSGDDANGESANGSRRRHRQATIWSTWALLFLGAFLLYALSASRGAQWQDRGQNILRIWTGEYVNPLGLALSHPLYFWLGRLSLLITPAPPALAVTLVSAVAGAIAVANLFACLHIATGHRASALYACGTLAVAHVYWQMATVAEMYTVTAALITAELWCLANLSRRYARRDILLLFFFNGLGVSNHLLSLLSLPVWVGMLILLARRGRATWRVGLMAAACWLVGASLYIYMICSEALRTGDLSATIFSALFGAYYADDVLRFSFDWPKVAVTLAFFALSLPTLAIPLALLATLAKPPCDDLKLFRNSTVCLLVVQFVFVVRYHVADQHTFLVPSIVLTCALTGLGFSRVRNTHRAWARAVLPAAVALLPLTPALYAFVPELARRTDVLRPWAHNKPYRDDYEYLFAPWSVVDDSAERMSQQAVALAAPNGAIAVEDRMAIFAVQYQVLRQRLDSIDVQYEPEATVLRTAVMSGRPVVLVPLNRDEPATELPGASWKRVGDLYVGERD